MVDTPGAAFVAKIIAGLFALAFSGVAIYFDIIQDKLTKRELESAIAEATKKEEIAKAADAEKAHRIAAMERTNADLKKGWADTTKQAELLASELKEAKTQSAEAKELGVKAATPKPFKDRLRAFLNTIDPRMSALISTGNTRFESHFNPAQFADLQRLCAEPEAKEFISIQIDPTFSLSDKGMMARVSITTTPALAR